MKLKEKMTALADAIRSKTGKTETLTIDGMIEAVGSIESSGGDTEAAYAQGKADERTAFWEVFQQGGQPMNLAYAFAYSKWTDDLYNPLYALNPSATQRPLTGMFFNSSTTDTKVELLGESRDLYGAFMSSNLITCRLVVDENTTYGGTLSYGNMFYNCKTIVNVLIRGVIGQNYFSLQWAPNVSHDSLVRIINCLSATAADLTVTFSTKAVNNAFETEEGLADGSTSEEWLNLIATRDNCTINLA